MVDQRNKGSAAAPRKRRTARPDWDGALAHLQSVAHEAHTMGRIYSRTGEKLKPGDEFERVDEMCRRYLAAARLKEASRGR